MKTLLKNNRSITEQYILTNINHPFMAKMTYCFQSELHSHFIMKYYRKGDFYQLLKSQPRKCLLESQVQFYSSCILLALEYLHLNKILTNLIYESN